MNSKTSCVLLVWSALPLLTITNAVGQAPTVKLSASEQKAVRQYEKQLITKLNSKDNPGDTLTYYVISFTETAQAKTESETGRSSTTVTVTTMWQSKVARDAILVQGRRNAAVELARYFNSRNKAAQGLQRPPGVDIAVLNAKSQKNWTAEPFLSEVDAQAYLAKVAPPKTKQ
jgi:hypothetical protein